MLNDKDRIFTNIYGWQEPNLTAAKKRGDWDDTKGILSLGHDEIVERMKKVWFAWAWWCWISNRYKMVFYAKRSY